MPTGVFRRTLDTILIVGLLLSGAGVAAAAKDAEKGAQEPQTLREKIDREVLRFRMQLTNGKVRLGRGIVGMGGVEIEGEATPFRLCCSSNLGVMRAAIDELQVLFDELNACYDRESIGGGKAGVEFARSDLKQFAKGLDGMEQAVDKRTAQMFMGGMTRAYLLLFESVEGLTPCDSSEPPASSKKKKRRKKSRKDKNDQ